MKKNFKKVSVVLMLALGTTFAMTSCGGGMTEEEAEKAAQEIIDGLDAAVEEATEEEVTEEGDGEEMTCGEGKCGDGMAADSAATCDGGDAAEATCDGGDAAE